MPTLLTVPYEYIKNSTRHAALSAALLIAANVYAACEVPPFDAPLEAQLARLSVCQRNPLYLAQLGHLLNAKGRYGEALEHLERALMFDPNLPAPQLDYAIALAGTGDLLSASQLIDSILDQPELPAELRQTLTEAKNQINRQQKQPTLALPPQHVHTLSSNLRYGSDSNLLGAPSLSTLALTTPGGTIILPLAESSAPRAGAYLRTDYRLDYTRNQPDGSRWELAAGGLERTSAEAPDANTQQTELTLGYSQNPRTPWAAYLGTLWVGIDTVGGTRYNSQSVTAGLQLPTPPGACRARAGLDWQDRDMASNPLLSGYYTGITTVLACTTWGGQWQLAARIGQDRPKDPSRTGGRQTLASLRGIGMWPTDGIGVIGTVLLDLEYNTARDTSGYSPLLDNNLVRQTNRLTTRLEYQRTISPHILATVGAEWSAQDANLSLFRVHSWGPYAALRLSW
jgi:tetratricopeptide (TPR) repeat protein